MTEFANSDFYPTGVDLAREEGVDGRVKPGHDVFVRGWRDYAKLVVGTRLSRNLAAQVVQE